MTTTPTAALVEEAEALNDLIQPGPFTKCGEDGDYWVENRHGQKLEEFRDRDMATFFARARTLVPELATALCRAEAELDAATTQLAKKFKRLEELEKRAEKAEAERDAQHALVLRLTGELQQSRKESLERARTVLMLDEDFDEACALGFGLGCMLTNAQWRERDAAERAQRGLKLMQSCLQDEERKVSELTATRDLLTEDNARLQA